MAFQAVHPWTSHALIGAFLDLALAYLLLSVSAYAFVVSKILNFWGICLPCPCTWVFGYKNSSFCLHKLLVDWPARKIYLVHKSVFCRFPFDLLLSKNQELESNAKLLVTNGKSENGVLELGHEASPGPMSGSRMQLLVDKGSGFDAKGKKVLNQKQKSGVRRRKRASLGYGKPSSVALSTNLSSAVAGASCSHYHELERRSKIDVHLGTFSNIGDGFHDVKIAQSSTDVEERNWHSFQLRGSYDKSRDVGLCGDEANKIQVLEQALEEERAAYAALYLELEKERAAAATAADEAMAMILRLQEDKALIEMETRQYQRMMEEKFTYDEEEMNILKEIIVRREKENHFLEKEIEAYKQMNVSGEEQLRNNLDMVKKGQNIAVSLDLNEMQGSATMLRPSSDLSSLTAELISPEETVTSEVKRGFHGDNYIVCQSILQASKTDSNDARSHYIGEGLERNGKLEDQPDYNPHSSVLHMEPAIYDVHVIDDHVNLRKEGNLKECDASSYTVLDKERNQISSVSVSEERWRLDTEVEQLRERLQLMQSEKEKWVFPTEHRERVSAQLKLMEEIVNQLREFQPPREPARQASLPPSSSFQVCQNKRRR